MQEEGRKLPISCPSCQQELQVARLHCGACDTSVEGRFQLPALTRLDPESRDFIITFVLASGSLKELASKLGVSYPTVRNRLNEVISRLEDLL